MTLLGSNVLFQWPSLVRREFALLRTRTHAYPAPGILPACLSHIHPPACAQYAHAQVGMHSYGASGPGAEVMKHFGFTVENVTAKAKQVRARIRVKL